VLPAASEALQATEEGYRLGKFDYVSVVDAQRTYAQLRRRRIEAIVSGLKAAIEIDRLGGCGYPNIPTMEVSDEK
jgi:cobalt-zinc-cadmium efflux system outer membrane protein